MNQNGIDHQNIKQYNFGTPYDLSTITLTSTAIILDDNNPFGMVFSKDGKRLFQTFADTGVVEQYSLNNRFDLSSSTSVNILSASLTLSRTFSPFSEGGEFDFEEVPELNLKLFWNLCCFGSELYFNSF